MSVLRGLSPVPKGNHRVIEACDDPAVYAGKAVFYSGARVPAEGFSFHPGEELCYIVSGEIVFGTEVGEELVKAGEFHHLDTAVLHYCRNDHEDECHLIYMVIKKEREERGEGE